MTKKKITGIAIVGLIVLCAGAVIAMKAAQPEAAESATIITAKQAQLASIESYNEGQNSFSDSFNPIIRERTLRDSGRKSVGLFIKNVYFRIVGDVAFDTTQLSAVLIPKTPGDPIVLDDPTSFIFHPLNGQVTLPPKAAARPCPRRTVGVGGDKRRGRAAAAETAPVASSDAELVRRTWA